MRSALRPIRRGTVTRLSVGWCFAKIKNCCREKKILWNFMLFDIVLTSVNHLLTMSLLRSCGLWWRVVREQTRSLRTDFRRVFKSNFKCFSSCDSNGCRATACQWPHRCPAASMASPCPRDLRGTQAEEVEALQRLVPDLHGAPKRLHLRLGPRRRSHAHVASAPAASTSHPMANGYRKTRQAPLPHELSKRRRSAN